MTVSRASFVWGAKLVDKTLLDTDMLSEIMKAKDVQVVATAVSAAQFTYDVCRKTAVAPSLPFTNQCQLNPLKIIR